MSTQGLDWRGAWLKAYGRDEMGNPDPNAIRSGQLDQQYLQEIINAQHVLLRDEAVKQEREKWAPRTAVCPCGYAADADQYHAMYAPLLQCWREWVEARRAYDEMRDALDESEPEALVRDKEFNAAYQRLRAAEAALANMRVEGET